MYHRTQRGENMMSCHVYHNPPTCVRHDTDVTRDLFLKITLWVTRGATRVHQVPLGQTHDVIIKCDHTSNKDDKVTSVSDHDESNTIWGPERASADHELIWAGKSRGHRSFASNCNRRTNRAPVLGSRLKSLLCTYSSRSASAQSVSTQTLPT